MTKVAKESPIDPELVKRIAERAIELRDGRDRSRVPFVFEALKEAGFDGRENISERWRHFVAVAAYLGIEDTPAAHHRLRGAKPDRTSSRGTRIYRAANGYQPERDD